MINLLKDLIDSILELFSIVFFDKNKLEKEQEEQWNISTYGLKVGDDLWCSRGWFIIKRIEEPNKVFVVKDDPA